MILPAISIRQPWAWAILHAGKDCENRTWGMPDHYINTPILIHASKRIDKEAVIHLLRLGFKVPEKMEIGGIVGVTEFSMTGFCGSCKWADFDNDMHHWIIERERTKPLPFFPCPGRLGFFRVDYPHELEAVCCK
jgi:hypothetical protein